MTKNNINWDTASQYKKNQKSDRRQSKQSLFHMLMLLMGIALLSASSCKKDPVATDSYPAVTSEGKNIWACKINGSPVVYSGVPTFGNERGVKASIYTENGIRTSVLLHASGLGLNNQNDNQTITVNIINPQINKRYYFNYDTCFYEYYNYYINFDHSTFNSTYKSGWVEFSRIDEIVSGIFEVHVLNTVSDSLKITEGRFDIKR